MPEPVVIATWAFGRTAVRTALPLLAAGKPALDAALAGAQAVEDDPAVRSVGYGAIGNSVGTVSRDACVMDGKTLDCGAVAGLENVRHAAAVARRVMEKTPHVLLVGDGALWFAIQQGFPLQTHHTPESVKDWYDRHPDNRNRRGEKGAVPADPSALAVGEDNHDTVTVLALDRDGHLGGVCTTSGLAYKLPGRVGDSPIIGAGLYVDDAAGAAGATGTGEEIIRINASGYMVELMRAGKSPQEACEAAVRRANALAVRRGKHPPSVAFLALDRQGRIGAACAAETNAVLAPGGGAGTPPAAAARVGFQYAVGRGGTVELLAAKEIGPEV
jgi:isoaspartyl peptidase/L-asparaginase-like protein (Ntn-hydrolase superfamily)